MTQRKQFDALVKSIDAKQGLVTSVVAVFGNVDVQNDRILPGAFTSTIVKWKDRMARGQFLPVVYGHQDTPSLILGKVVDLRQTSEGLEVDEQYFLHKPQARDALDAQVEGVLGGSSFAYDVIRAKRASDGVQNLIELDLIEVGPTIYPANDSTRLVGVKAEDEAKSGEPEVKAEEPFLKHNALARHKGSVRQIRDLAEEMLSALEGMTEDKTDEPSAKVEVPDLNSAFSKQLHALVIEGTT